LSSQVTSTEQLRERAASLGASLVVAIHALRAGRFCVAPPDGEGAGSGGATSALDEESLPFPFILVLGGTDVNVSMRATLGPARATLGPARAGAAGAVGAVAGGAGAVAAECRDASAPLPAVPPPSPLEAEAAIIARVLLRAAAVVAFTEALAADASAFAAARLPPAEAAAVTARTHLIPQSVDLGEEMGDAGGVDVGGGACGGDARVSGGEEGSGCEGPPATPAATPRAAPAPLCAPLRAHLGLAPDEPVVLLPAGLRAVKAPTFLLPAWRAWVGGGAAPRGSTLLILGPPLDDAVAEEVRRETTPSPCGCGQSEGTSVICEGNASTSPDQRSASASATPPAPAAAPGSASVFYHPPVPRATLLRWMAEADALLNSSISEGQSNAILEALAIGCPVAARANSGNAALLGGGACGALFATPEEGIRALADILGEGEGGAGVEGTRAAPGEAERSGAAPGEAVRSAEAGSAPRALRRAHA
jgi:hypothetical protein